MAEEHEVSLLIPAFGRKAMTLDAVACALATGAGEIVVSLDTDPDGLEAPLRALRDPRLRLVVQPARLGLWPHHLALLKLATRPYVKFLQTDDALLPGGLRRLCDEMTLPTAIVSALPYYLDRATGAAWQVETGAAPGRWTSSEYLARAVTAGNDLGRPSYTLLRRVCITLDERCWHDDLSADWLMNLLAATQGEAAIVGHGAVVCGVHPAQDGATQPLQLVARRLTSTLEALATHPDARLRPIVSAQAGAGLVTVARGVLGTLRRGRSVAMRAVARELVRLVSLADRSLVTTRDGRQALRAAVAARRPGRRRPLTCALPMATEPAA